MPSHWRYVSFHSRMWPVLEICSSLLVDFLKDWNLWQLAVHPVVRQPGMAVVNDLEMHLLPCFLACKHNFMSPS